MEERNPIQRDPTTDRSVTIVRGLGSLTVYSAVSAFLSLVQFTALVRLLPQTSYGAFTSVQVSESIATVVAGMGLGSAVVRYLARPSTAKGPDWGPAKAATLLTVAFAGAISLLFALGAPYLSNYFLKSPSDAWIFYLGAIWVFLATIDHSFLGMLQGTRRYSRYAAVLLTSRLVSVSVTIVGVALYQNLEIAIAAMSLHAALVILTILPTVFGPLHKATARGTYGQVLRYSWPLGLAGTVSVVAANADIVVVGGFLTSSALAVYNAAVTISSVLSAFFVTPIVTALFAEASLSSRKAGELKLGTNLSIRFMLMTMLPASLFAAAMSPQLFDLFSGGGNYSRGIPYLRLITLFYVFTAIQTLAINILQGVSRTRQVLMVGAVMALGEIALSASLVPGLGLAGAAYSRVVIFVLGCGLSLYYIRDYILRPVNYGFYARALLASAIPSVAVYIPSVYYSSSVTTIVPYALLGLTLYLLCAKMLKLLTPEDKSYVGHMLPAGLHWVLRFL